MPKIDMAIDEIRAAVSAGTAEIGAARSEATQSIRRMLGSHGETSLGIVGLRPTSTASAQRAPIASGATLRPVAALRLNIEDGMASIVRDLARRNRH